MPRKAIPLLFLCLQSALVRAQTSVPTQATLVITGVSVIDATGSPPQTDRTVVIAGDRIEAIVNAGALAAIPKSARIIYGRGRFLIPGLWDMHVHLTESRLPALVAYGVTGVRDMGNVLSDVDGWRARINAGVLVGPDISRVGPILNGKSFGPAQVAITNSVEARVAVRLLKQAGVDAIKVHSALPRDAYFAVADEAKKQSIRFVGHVPPWITIEEASDAGQASIEHIEMLYDRNPPVKADVAPAVFARLAKNNTAYTPTLVAFRGSADSANIDPGVLAKHPEIPSVRKKMFGEFLNLVALMNRAGVNLLAGTDLGVKWISPGRSLHEELALLVDAGLTPMQALQAATRNPAQFLGVNAGTVEPGKIANLILLDSNPLQDIRNTTRIQGVILKGKYFDREQLDKLLTGGFDPPGIASMSPPSLLIERLSAPPVRSALAGHRTTLTKVLRTIR
jgi:imidazolonepropionase-like amidohydrolase